MTIRRAEEKDIPDVARLLSDIFRIHADARPDLFCSDVGRKYSDGELRALFHDDTRPVFVACHGGDVVGYVFCIYEGDVENGRGSLYIDDLCVDATRRGEGIGKALYDHAVRTAKKNGCYRLYLNVWSFNEPAVRFYTRQKMTPLKTYMEKIL